MPILPDPDSPGAAQMIKPTILLLGDTGEADELAEALRSQGDCRLMRPGAIIPAAVAQLGSIDGFTALLREMDIRLVINAASPYDTAQCDRALAATTAADRPLLRLSRPAWHRDPLDSWIDVASAGAAADICRWYGKRIMITLGESDLTPFAGNDRCHFIVRLPAAPAIPLDLAHYDLIIGTGPFAWLDERRLMMEQQIDLLVSRNVGGLDSYAKIDVARDLAIPVVMISRPSQPLQSSADSVAQALIWIDAWRQAERGHAAES